MARRSKEELENTILTLTNKDELTTEQALQRYEAERELQQVKLIESGKIRITISCGRSTDYVEEYWIKNTEGDVVKPWDFPNEWSGKVFQLVEVEDENSQQSNS